MATKQMRRFAMSIQSNMDVARKLGPFNSEEWYKRKDAIAMRVENRQRDAHAKAVLRKELAKPGSQDPKEVKDSKKIVEAINKRKPKALRK